MKKYQIYETTDLTIPHAVSKAPDDVKVIAQDLDFGQLTITKVNDGNHISQRLGRQRRFIHDWHQAYKKISRNSIVLLQHPFRTRQIGREYYLTRLKTKKNVRFISLIHDIEELRQSLYDDYYKAEFNFMLKIADVLIVHNNSMKKELLKKGVPNKKIVVLEIFDYLRENYSDKEASFSKNITIAGNLSAQKSAYLDKLKQLELFFELYGPNYNLKNGKNHQYHGVVDSAKLPKYLTSGFGLVWDGTSINECNGPTGNYLRYNNPHKLSLYLASNLPVIVWKNAAEANFVEKNKVGIAITSLKELESILSNLSEEEYDVYANNARKIGKKLVNGFYTKSALKKSINIIESQYDEK